MADRETEQGRERESAVSCFIISFPILFSRAMIYLFGGANRSSSTCHSRLPHSATSFLSTKCVQIELHFFVAVFRRIADHNRSFVSSITVPVVNLIICRTACPVSIYITIKFQTSKAPPHLIDRLTVGRSVLDKVANMD